MLCENQRKRRPSCTKKKTLLLDNYTKYTDYKNALFNSSLVTLMTSLGLSFQHHRKQYTIYNYFHRLNYRVDYDKM